MHDVRFLIYDLAPAAKVCTVEAHLAIRIRSDKPLSPH
jgi:hypothetical protein